MKRARNLTAVVVAVCLLGVGAYAQEPCTAQPRWLVVTVVGSWSIFTKDGERVGETINSAGPQQQLLDRCSLGESPYVGDVNPLYPDPLDDHGPIWDAGGRTVIRAHPNNQTIYPYQVLYLVETVQAICAAMDDCGDATQQ